MKAENREFLERFRQQYTFYVKDRAIPKNLHIDLKDKKRMLEVAREEFDKNYTACVTCSADFLVLFNYLFVQMDKKEGVSPEPANVSRNYKRKTRR